MSKYNQCSFRMLNLQFNECKSPHIWLKKGKIFAKIYLIYFVHWKSQNWDEVKWGKMGLDPPYIL